jgi:hypothetical protein
MAKIGSLRENKSQGTQHFISRNPHGGENPTKTSLIYISITMPR